MGTVGRRYAVSVILATFIYKYHKLLVFFPRMSTRTVEISHDPSPVVSLSSVITTAPFVFYRTA